MGEKLLDPSLYGPSHLIKDVPELFDDLVRKCELRFLPNVTMLLRYLKIKGMAGLRILGRDNCFDDIHEFSGVPSIVS